MPITFNETVPTIKDALTHAGFEEKDINAYISQDAIYNDYLKDEFLVLVPINIWFNNFKNNGFMTIDCCPRVEEENIHKLEEFISTTSSEYVVWDRLDLDKGQNNDHV